MWVSLRTSEGKTFRMYTLWAKDRTSCVGTERSMRMSVAEYPKKCWEILSAATDHMCYVEIKFNQISEVAGRCWLPSWLQTMNNWQALSSWVLVPNTSSLTLLLQPRLRVTESELEHSILSKLRTCTRAQDRAPGRSTPRVSAVREAVQAGDEKWTFPCQVDTVQCWI